MKGGGGVFLRHILVLSVTIISSHGHGSVVDVVVMDSRLDSLSTIVVSGRASSQNG